MVVGGSRGRARRKVRALGRTARTPCHHPHTSRISIPRRSCPRPPRRALPPAPSFRGSRVGRPAGPSPSAAGCAAATWRPLLPPPVDESQLPPAMKHQACRRPPPARARQLITAQTTTLRPGWKPRPFSLVAKRRTHTRHQQNCYGQPYPSWLYLASSRRTAACQPRGQHTTTFPLGSSRSAVAMRSHDHRSAPPHGAQSAQQWSACSGSAAT
jgi:hypothetical protein